MLESTSLPYLSFVMHVAQDILGASSDLSRLFASINTILVHELGSTFILLLSFNQIAMQYVFTIIGHYWAKIVFIDYPK